MAAIAAAIYARRAAEHTQVGATQAKRSADAAIESNKLNREAFVADQRPWLAAEISVDAPLELDGHNANFSLKIILRNVGNTPAFNIVEAFAMHHGYGQTAHGLKLFQNLAASAFAGQTKGDVLFPGDKREIENAFYMGPKELDAARKRGDFSPMLLIFFGYTAVHPDVRYQTGYIVDLYTTEDGHPHWSGAKAIDVDGGDIPPERLFLGYHPSSSITT